MENMYDSWNNQKKMIALETEQPPQFPKEGEVHMCILGKNIGREQDGSGDTFLRPVLVVKKFNNNLFWIVPLSTKQKQLDFYYNFTDPHDMNVSAILAQLRVASIKRFKRFLYILPASIYRDLRQKLFSM